MIKLISINIEGDLHVDTVEAFLKKEKPDVVAFQEIFESDFNRLTHSLGMHGLFVPMCLAFPFQGNYRGPIVKNTNKSRAPIGVAFLSVTPIERNYSKHYLGTPEHIPDFVRSVDLEKIPHSPNALVLGVEIKKENNVFRFFTTHMPVTKDGETAPFQLKSVDDILSFLSDFDEFAFCGDLNAPRGKEAFSRFTAHYKDNIPSEYKTSLDQVIHRRFVNNPENLGRFMVDGLFTTPRYEAHDVRLQDGVSDHMAIVANISLAQK